MHQGSNDISTSLDPVCENPPKELMCEQLTTLREATELDVNRLIPVIDTMNVCLCASSEPIVVLGTRPRSSPAPAEAVLHNMAVLPKYQLSGH